VGNDNDGNAAAAGDVYREMAGIAESEVGDEKVESVALEYARGLSQGGGKADVVFVSAEKAGVEAEPVRLATREEQFEHAARFDRAHRRTQPRAARRL